MIYVIRKILPVFASSILLSTLPKIICLSLNTSTSFIPYNFIHQNRQFVSAERPGNSRDSSVGIKPSAYSTITRPSPLTMSYGAWRCHGKTNSEMVEKLAMVSSCSFQRTTTRQPTSQQDIVCTRTLSSCVHCR